MAAVLCVAYAVEDTAASGRNTEPAKENTSVMLTGKMYSSALGEEREYCVYLPSGFVRETAYPVIFAADGQILFNEGYKTVLDSLISNKIIPATILIGMYSNEEIAEGGNVPMRYFEYVPQEGGSEESRIQYEGHLDFFTGEIRNEIKEKYGIETDPLKCIFYGFSNGGDYGINIMTGNKGGFTDYICFSPVGTAADQIVIAPNSRLRLYLAYGSEELISFMGFNLMEIDEKLTNFPDPRIYRHVYEGGHARELWKEEFSRILPLLFAGKE